MRKSNKKGFTIVELVIVIAVIAILAAVLIPTFISLTKKANESKDTQLIHNLNTAVKIANPGADKFNTAHEAVLAAAEGGFELSKIAASQDGNYILWDAAKQCFAYLKDGEVVYSPETADSSETGKIQLWKITDELKTDETYSIYYTGTETTVNVTVGFDAGTSSVNNITYTGTEKGVVIRTTGGTLTVNNSSADVNHYGSAQLVDIKACANESYHEFGFVTTLTVTSGRVVIEKGAVVGSIPSVGNGATVTKEGGIVGSAPEGSNLGSTEDEKKNYALEIGTAAELASFRDSVNSGMTFEGLTVKLTADIDLSAYANWNPIGNRYALNSSGKVVDYNDSDTTAVRRIFKGTFDGQGHTIRNMNINSLSENYPGLRATLSDATTSSYAALFGYISNAILKNFTLSGTVVGVDVAGVVGITMGNCTIENVTSNVTVTGTNGKNEENEIRGKAAGFVCCPKGDALTIKNCTNSGDISGASNKSYGTEPVGGFVAYHSWGALTIENCVNSGKVTHSGQTAAGFVGIIAYKGKNSGAVDAWKDGWHVVIRNCKNTGEISGYYAGAAVGSLGLGDGTLSLPDFTNSANITATNNNTYYQKNDNVGNYNGNEIELVGTTYQKKVS